MFFGLIQEVREFFIPGFCSYCRQFFDQAEIVLCDTCAALIKPLVTVNLKITQNIQVPVFAVSGYQEPLRSLILAKHFRNRSASEQLGKLLWYKTAIRSADFDYIVPVPLHWTRYAWRWYNQAEVIASVISRHSGKPVLPILKRVMHTKFQAGLSKQARKENIDKAFVLRDKKSNLQDYTYKKFLIIDDVMTTGSTITYAIKELLKLSPEKITVAVAARVV